MLACIAHMATRPLRRWYMCKAAQPLLAAQRCRSKAPGTSDQSLLPSTTTLQLTDEREADKFIVVGEGPILEHDTSDLERALSKLPPELELVARRMSASSPTKVGGWVLGALCAACPVCAASCVLHQVLASAHRSVVSRRSGHGQVWHLPGVFNQSAGLHQMVQTRSPNN